MYEVGLSKPCSKCNFWTPVKKESLSGKCRRLKACTLEGAGNVIVPVVYPMFADASCGVPVYTLRTWSCPQFVARPEHNCTNNQGLSCVSVESGWFELYYQIRDEDTGEEVDTVTVGVAKVCPICGEKSPAWVRILDDEARHGNE